MAPHFLLVTVAEDSRSSRADLRRLLDSIAAQDVTGELLLVMRGGGAPPDPVPANLRLHLVPAPRLIGLSRARNLALAHARRYGLLSRVDAVAFPDDDCRYPAGLLEAGASALAGGTEVVCGPYRPADEPLDHARFPAEARPLTPSLVMRVASSNNVLLAAGAVARLGDFDERLGLGGRYGASEDSDYVIRALRAGSHGRYLPELIVEHPYKRHRPAQYYAGNIAVLAKHARGGALRSLVHKLALGAVWTLRGRLPAREWARGVAAATRMARA